MNLGKALFSHLSGTPGMLSSATNACRSRFFYYPLSPMLRLYIFLSLCMCGEFCTHGAERFITLSETNLNETPKGFRSSVSGGGKPGEWKVILAEVPSLMPSFNPSAAGASRPVLAQLSRDSTDEHYPLLIFEDETYGDFTLTTRFKTVAGAVEQMAGIAFRLQDEKNFYYVRASSLGNTFRFFKVVNGERSAPIGPEVEITKNVWHQLQIECNGNKIRCLLDEKEIIPTLTDSSFSAGKFAFWTKSDSVSYFTDTKIVYTPHESLAKVLIREMKREYPRIRAMRVYANKSEIKIIASTDEREVGHPGGVVELDVIEKDAPFYGRSDRNNVLLTLPLHDRNGDVIAALRLEMDSFPGQTENNALARALPVVKDMERRIHNAQDLF